MNKFRLNYVLAIIVMVIVEAYVVINIDRFGAILAILGFLIIGAIVVTYVFSDDMVDSKYTHAVVDKDRRILALCESQEAAIKFADELEMDNKVVMLHIK